jgi:hypothetical protein
VTATLTTPVPAPSALPGGPSAPGESGGATLTVATRLGNIPATLAVTDRHLTVHVEGTTVQPSTMRGLITLGATPPAWYSLAAAVECGLGHGGPVQQVIDLARLPDATKRTRAERGTLPTWGWHVLVRDRATSVRTGIARATRRHDVPGDVITRLLHDPSDHVRENLAVSSRDPHLLAILAADPDVTVRTSAARNRHTPGPSVAALAQDDHVPSRRRIAERDDLPEHLMRALAADGDTETRSIIARRRDLPEDLTWTLACDRLSVIRLYIAERAVLTAALLDHLIADKAASVRRVTARRRGLPVTAQQRLATDDDAQVRAYIAARSDVPLDLLTVLSIDPAPHVRNNARSALQRRTAQDTITVSA